MYQETFVSPIGVSSRKKAQDALTEIRAYYKGWIELKAYVTKLGD